MITYIDFQPLIITRTAEIRPLSIIIISVTVADKGYDSEGNHVPVRERLHAFSVIQARFKHIPTWIHMLI